MKILGLIPARAGSKGIPDKNRKELAGKPLLLYTIEAALAANSLDRVVFSSEDETLRNMAENAGVEVPFIRPTHLAEDHSGSLEVVQHALKELSAQGSEYDAVCLLQVTTPFRTASDIDAAVSAFISAKTDSLISVQEVPHQYNPHWVFERNKDNSLQLATGASSIIKRRQDLPPAYIRDGAIYITKTSVLLEDNSFFGKSISSIQLNPDTHVNIDTEEDWIWAEKIATSLK
ncbi:acylneuraminate cytidylyltransferase family protein [Constantimarinum furrinae]|uniref:Acylneuraminate cytidylyltransferase n=1 Tax=Constantimarinum furrinae TaxID=2562285 RepID=A0A7G8PQT3_9FLAO|nr:acylneuraminate cytidylyltransferase family protein [Constantimarinum furrinae]QNJ96699.1 Acylneuraminate cytidylyltransferase [Constantimarinum furrinae]